MVAIIPGTKRDHKHEAEQQLNKKDDNSFAGELEKAMEDYIPADIHTVTYNSKSQLQPFFYSIRRDYTI